MKKDNALRRAPQIHIRVTEEDIKKLDDLVKHGNDPFNSQARVLRNLIRDAWNKKYNLATSDG